MKREMLTSMSLDRSLSRRRALQLAGAAGLVTLAGPNLTFAQATPAAELPELKLVAVEYSFELSGEPVAGWTRVVLDNQGTMDHHVMLLKVHDHATLADLEAALETPDLGAIFPLAASVGGPGVGPGMSSTVVLDLAPGDYVAVCVVPDEEGTPHYLLGQKLAFSVAAGDATGAAPTADLRVEMTEMAFANLPTELPAGEQVWEVANTGEQLHETLVLALAEGMTIEQGMQIFTGGEAPAEGEGESTPAMDMEMGPPPFTGIGGVAPLSPGLTNYLLLDLTPGNYLTICFVPDAATGMPHFMMGMLAGFSVA